MIKKIAIIIVIILVAIFGWYFWGQKSIKTPPTSNPFYGTYVIDGKAYALIEGTSQKKADSGSDDEVIIETLEIPVYGSASAG